MFLDHCSKNKTPYLSVICHFKSFGWASGFFSTTSSFLTNIGVPYFPCIWNISSENEGRITHFLIYLVQSKVNYCSPMEFVIHRHDPNLNQFTWSQSYSLSSSTFHLCTAGTLIYLWQKPLSWVLCTLVVFSSNHQPGGLARK